MAKKTVKYFKLGTRSHTFVDVRTHFQLSNKSVAPATHRQMSSRSFIQALGNGHITDATKEEYDDYIKASKIVIGNSTSSKELKTINSKLQSELASKEEELIAKEEEITNLKEKIAELEAKADEDDDPINFQELTKKELKEYLVENYDISPEELVKFEKLNHDEEVKYITKLENETE